MIPWRAIVGIQLQGRPKAPTGTQNASRISSGTEIKGGIGLNKTGY